MLFCFRGVAVADALQVQCFIDVFEEVEADNAVVSALVFLDGGFAAGGLAAEGAVYPCWVEDFVHALSYQ